MTEPFDDEALAGYLAETLPSEDSARIEKALRDSADLRARLEAVRQGRTDAGLHSLAAIWRRNRLSCPSRQTLGSYLLDALDPDQADYVMFHLDVIQCAFCLANVADLNVKAAAPEATTVRKRIYHSSRHLLGNEG